jgi:hypothetical protein
MVTEAGVLELELRHAPTSGQDSDEANEHEVGEGSQGARCYLPASIKRGPSFGAHSVVSCRSASCALLAHTRTCEAFGVTRVSAGTSCIGC